MAKRKRLTPAAITDPIESTQGGLETKSAVPFGNAAPSRPPIAQVAGDASSQAALEEVSAELHAARTEGRLVQALPLHAIKADHLVRDRMHIDASEMEALKNSLKARGQQTPIEVVDLGRGSYGLISGWRRLNALNALQDETGEARFGQIQALIKPITDVSDSYIAMVEENEIRANLSYYERARLAAEAAKLGVYPTAQRAVQALFAASSSSKRSKISSFLHVHGALESALSFPEAIPERLGLALAGAIEKDRQFSTRLADLLRKQRPETAAQERRILDRALARTSKGGDASAPRSERLEARDVAPGIKLEARKGRVVLSGKGVTAELQEALTAWLAAR